MSFWVFVGANAFARWRAHLGRAACLVMVVAFLALTAAILARGFEAGRFPLANLYESLIWFAWATMGVYLFLARSYEIYHLGWLASLLAATMFLYGSWLPASQHELSPLVPALVSYWRQIHVPPLIVSYAMFFLAGLSGLLHLWMSGRRAAVHSVTAAIFLGGAAVALGTYTSVSSFLLQGLFVGGSIAGLCAGWWQLARVAETGIDPGKAEIYDDLSYRLITIGFPLLTIGIITGGLWANHAWGTYWSWDPKESMALVTWLSYAAYIHLRIHRHLSADKLALVAASGMLLTLLTYLGFNTLGFGGLHSYGQFK